MTIKEKIQEYLEYKGVSPTRAERELSWGVGAFTKAKSITADRAKELLLLYKDLSAEWLLRDKGEMLLIEDAGASSKVQSSVDHQNFNSEIERLKTLVARLEGQNDLLREQLGLPERVKVKSVS